LTKWWLIPCLCASAAAQAPVYRPGPDIVAPFVAAKTPPLYTDEARLAKLEGGVLLSLVVGSDGQPRDIRVVRPLGLGLDERAIESVRSWRFEPGTRNSIPVEVQIGEEVFFREPRNLWDWHLVRAVFRPPPGTTRPVLIHAKFPPTVDIEENALVTIAFDVGLKGVPMNPRVLKSSNAKWDREVLQALQTGWRFRPAKRDGAPATVPAWFEFVRGSHSPIPAADIPIPPGQ
jgi:TonB family protein